MAFYLFQNEERQIDELAQDAAAGLDRMKARGSV
jgi:hypothetical protein